MVDRKNQPEIRQVSGIKLPKPELHLLDNGMKVYSLPYPQHDILKFELVYYAGQPQETKRLVARTTARMLREGTHKMTSGEIAEQLDFYGTGIGTPTNLDTANVVVFCLKKYFPTVLPIVGQVVLEPSFPENELETYKRTCLQDLQIELEKIEVQAYRTITEKIFGEAHPYGYNSQPADYQAITREDLIAFHHKWYTPANGLIFISGAVDAEIIAEINRQFGQIPMQGDLGLGFPEVVDAKPKKLKMPIEKSHQVAINICRRLFNKTHEDYGGVFVLNTILGGYFGSRLMANIREKKGFTYNIYSTADAMMHDGCFYIATEVNREFLEPARKEIFKEMKKLCDKPVPESELNMVKNYLLGMVLTGVDGPVNTSDVVKGMVVENLPWTLFETLVETIKNITAEEIQALAKKYLNKRDFWEVNVG